MMILGYCCAAVIAVIFMLYLDGEIGVMMLAFLLLMPILSLIVTLWVRRTLKVSLILPESRAKHRPIAMQIVLEKQTRLPMPFLRMRLTADAHFSPLNPAAEELSDAPLRGEGILAFFRYQKAYKAWRKSLFTQLTPDMIPFCCSMGTERKKVLKLTLEGEFCGTGMISLSQCVMTDFLRMFHFQVREDKSASVLLLPEPARLKISNELFRSVSNEAITADEESEMTPTYSASTTAGYEHRDYVAGDSLKRINWKLSSKRHRLMVRLDEPVALSKLAVVLDFRRPANTLRPRQLFEQEQQITETALGLVKICLQQGFPCMLYFLNENGAWVGFCPESPEQLEVEAVTLLRGGFRSPAELSMAPLVPDTLPKDQSGIVIWFAEKATTELASALGSLASASLYCVLPQPRAENAASHQNAMLPSNTSIWYATSENNLVPSNP